MFFGVRRTRPSTACLPHLRDGSCVKADRRSLAENTEYFTGLDSGRGGRNERRKKLAQKGLTRCQIPDIFNLSYKKMNEAG